MGTFHDDKGELHGITVAVDAGETIYVGRCHEENAQHVLLLDADEHVDGTDGVSKAEWLSRAARWGVFAKHKVLDLPRNQVVSITRLGDVATSL